MRNLLGDINLSLHPVQRARIARIEAEYFTPIIRKVVADFREVGFFHDDDYLERGIYALKQYYVLPVLDPSNAHAVSAVVDPFWHAHILHTEQYVDFCQQTVGTYMHHRPLDKKRLEHVEAVRMLYNYTRLILPQIFGHVDEEFWPENCNDSQTICWHKGGGSTYPALEEYRSFEPISGMVGYERDIAVGRLLI